MTKPKTLEQLREEVRAENCSDFSHSPKQRQNCSQVLWYNLNTKLRNKSLFEIGKIRSQKSLKFVM